MKRMGSVVALALGVLMFSSPVFADHDKTPEQRKEALLKRIDDFIPKMEKQNKDLMEDIRKETGEIVGIGMEVDNDSRVVYVSWLSKNSPVARAGVMRGDDLISVNGKPATSAKDATAELYGDGKPGRTVVLVLRRDGKDLSISVTAQKLRNDKSKEALELVKAIESESLPLLAKVRERLVPLRQAVESGTLPVEQVTREHPLVKSANEAIGEFNQWLYKKSEDAKKILLY